MASCVSSHDADDDDDDDGDDVIATSCNKAVCNIDFNVLDMMVKSAFIMLT